MRKPNEPEAMMSVAETTKSNSEDGGVLSSSGVGDSRLPMARKRLA